MLDYKVSDAELNWILQSSQLIKSQEFCHQPHQQGTVPHPMPTSPHVSFLNWTYHVCAWEEELRSQALAPAAKRAGKEIFLISTLGQARRQLKVVDNLKMTGVAADALMLVVEVFVFNAVFGTVSLQETEIHCPSVSKQALVKVQNVRKLSMLVQLAFIGTEGLQAATPSTFPSGSGWSFISASPWMSASYYLPNVNSLCNVLNLCFPKNSFIVCLWVVKSPMILLQHGSKTSISLLS